MLGIHPATLRRWEAAGKVVADRTPGGHRRYDLQALMTLAGKLVDEAELSCVIVAMRVFQATIKRMTWRRSAMCLKHSAQPKAGLSRSSAT